MQPAPDSPGNRRDAGPDEAARTASLARFWQPRHWPAWIGIGILRLASFLPVRGQLALGRGLGRLLYRLLPGRRRIAAVNLALCFPEQSAADRQELLRRHFESLGMTVMEQGLAWWGSDAFIERHVELVGEEHLEVALATGRRVVLLTGHFASQELTGRAMKLRHPTLAVLYRPSKDPMIDEILRRVRGRSASILIPKQSMRRMIRTLRNGIPVWYAPDQSHRRAMSALVPFFGEPAMTTTALTEIVRLADAVVVPLMPTRLRDDMAGQATGHGAGQGAGQSAGQRTGWGRYVLEILPPVAGFPGESPVEDARRINELLEAHVRQVPEQYFWIHRRFKGRPAPLPDPYAGATDPPPAA